MYPSCPPVLVAANHEAFRYTIGRMVELHGRSAQTVADENLIALARWIEPALILIDVDSRGSNPFALCQSLRCEPWGRRVVVVALTSLPAKTCRARWELAGFDYCCDIPFEHAMLGPLLQMTAQSTFDPSRTLH
jgi:CheY-like chemotaxis protein